MTDIRKKARVLLNAAREAHVNPDDYLIGQTAVCLAIEQHEAFKQEVSDVLLEYYGGYHNAIGEPLERFIIPKTKPDPLVEVMKDLSWDEETAAEEWAKTHWQTQHDFEMYLREQLSEHRQAAIAAHSAFIREEAGNEYNTFEVWYRLREERFVTLPEEDIAFICRAMLDQIERTPDEG